VDGASEAVADGGLPAAPADAAGVRSGVRTAMRRRLRAGRTVLTDRPRLVLASFVMLFVELGLIRYTSANVVYLVHLTNFVLLASFLGIGIGFLRGGAGRDVFRLAPLALAALVGFVLAFPVVIASLVGSRQVVGAFGMRPLPRWASLTVIFVLTVAVMATLAQEVARTFARLEPLEAYRLDVLGSIGGIVAFAGLSFLRLPPLVWAVLAAAAVVALLGPGRNGRMTGWQWAGVAVLVGLLGGQSLLGNYHWSPYYKIRAVTEQDGRSLAVAVNNVPHQTAFPMDRMEAEAPFYFYPYAHLTSVDDVLVIGAGTGNDVAVALARGAQRVDAVEIDPVLQRLGRDHHAEQPYQDRRVSVHIDDGRAFLERTGRRYDLIVLALTDSATIVTGQSALRLENYLFTTEALARARSLLKPRGTFAMYNYYESWLLDRYANSLSKVYGRPPCMQTGGPTGRRLQAVLTVTADGTTPGCATVWQASPGTLAPASDDRPFPYIADRTIPRFYLWMLGLILVASVVLVRLTSGSLRRMRPYLDLSFMGAAFLLLETKNVVQFALLFGTTWFVNAAVFAGILLSVLAAIEVARRLRLPRPWLLYGALLGALALAWAIPPAALLDLPVPLRFLAGVAVAFTPIFLANLVFAQRFRNVAASTVAFGANLLGAMVGGVVEYLALVTGYRFLLIVVAVLYGLAFLTGRRHISAVPA
jgi:spermidine synthase